MAQQFIHVKIGPVDGVYPVRELIPDGPMHDMYEYQKDAHTIGWVHKRWCTPVTTQQNDTDWRKFLHDHWDTEHNHCRVEYLEEFMAVFRRAAAACVEKKQASKPAEPAEPVPRPAPKPKKPHYVELSLFPDL